MTRCHKSVDVIAQKAAKRRIFDSFLGDIHSFFLSNLFCDPGNLIKINKKKESLSGITNKKIVKEKRMAGFISYSLFYCHGPHLPKNKEERKELIVDRVNEKRKRYRPSDHRSKKKKRKRKRPAFGQRCECWRRFPFTYFFFVRELGAKKIPCPFIFLCAPISESVIACH